MSLRVISCLCGNVQWQETRLARLVGVGVLREEQLHHSHVTVLGGLIQSGGAICCLAVDVGTCRAAHTLRKTYTLRRQRLLLS